MRPEIDAVMVSFDEPDANDLHHRLEQVLARPVKRLHGIVGMRRAYELTAEAATTATYLLADGDFAVDDDFDPAAAGPLPAGVSMRVWQARNPINGLVYGYGGLKLVRRSHLRQLRPAVDVLAGLPCKTEFTPALGRVWELRKPPVESVVLQQVSPGGFNCRA